MSAGFIDLHAHVLPGVDDGPESLPVALEVVRALRDLGFTMVCATPHQKAETFTAAAAEIDGALADLRRAVAVDLPEVELLRGAEIYWDDWFFERSRDGALPLFEGDRAFLLELVPGAAPPRLEDHLFRFRAAGVLPVLAHPERYHDLVADDDRLAKVAQVAALVVDLAALGELFGSGRARRLVTSGLAHAVASDIHGVAERRHIERGMTWIEKKLGAAALRRLLTENPQRILAGELPE